MPVSPSARRAPAAASVAPRTPPRGGGHTPIGVDLSAIGWNLEASELVKELTATQQEVAALLIGQAEQEQELSGLREACSSELEELEEQTWRLQLFAELEKMKGLITQLEPIEDDATPPPDDGEGPMGEGAPASAAGGARPAPPLAVPSLAADGGGARDGDDGAGDREDEETAARALAGIDDELETLTARIRVAREEVTDLLARKWDLEQAVADVYAAELEGDDEGGGGGCDGSGSDAGAAGGD
ncbi:hypothetical protein Rsub_04414 [Raphidocelis subcapitata]|uniref:Uncharacterized protein n=1 Tax=Raphidocelis subcapitata TaxID=307507 RepID=A0A2V0P4E6_9CHLO|nr:hypothetical protein Rsub_04414 [Raphidocelis subcapitata]|eukprot:GBF92067.1 hypothetical protein Rsub_04414 [Raphidocelis subcapitata]